MSELIYCIDFQKHLELPRIVDYVFSLGHSLNQLKEKDDCYRFEYKTIKELKQRGYTQFFKKQLTPDINFIIAKQKSPQSSVIAVH